MEKKDRLLRLCAVAAGLALSVPATACFDPASRGGGSDGVQPVANHGAAIVSDSPRHPAGESAEPPQQFTEDGHPLGLETPPSRIPSGALGCIKASGGGPPPKLSFDPVYDPRPLGLVTPVRDLGTCNASWAFATYAAFESLLLPGETWDFSENNLKNTHGFTRAPCAGGDFYMSTAYHARGSGPVSESDDPYDPGSGVSPPGLPQRKQVMDVLHVPVQPMSYTDYYKNLVLSHGAVAVGMLFRSADYNPATYAHYTNVYGMNLAATIVGWDDTFPASRFNFNPGSDGAWIVKNAWGTDWGEAGYFYVSYKDGSFGQIPTIYAGAAPPTQFDRILQYDPFGWTNSLPTGDDAGWAANVFTAGETLFLTAVATYTVFEWTDYAVKIYTGGDGLPGSGTLAASYGGTKEFSGFHVLPISGPPVPVNAGEKFSVVVNYGKTACQKMIPIEMQIAGYTDAADANPGESFTSLNGVDWTDLNAPVNTRRSACIKALALVTATYCNDNDPCTQDEWDGSQCAHPPSTAPCDDGLGCTEGDVCSAYECHGSPVSGKCAIAGACYDDGEINPSDDCLWCQAAVDPQQWKPRPVGTPCTSGNECIRDETCDVAAQCIGTAEPDTKPCDDGQNCTTDDHCDGAGTCAGAAYSCPAPGQCEVSVTCDGAGGCARVFKDQGTACADGEICTWNDMCDGAGGCAGTPYTCEPNECQYTSVCDGLGGCETTSKPEYTFCTPDTNDCTDDVCRSGQCVHQAVPNNTPCNDGSLCTTVDKCQAGTCVGGSPIQCQAQDSCHEIGVCDPQTGQCSNPVKSEGSACDDGLACTKDDRCDDQRVCVGTSYVCAPTECQSSSQCDGLGGCITVNKTNGISCSPDGNSCTDDLCQAGQCAHNPRAQGSNCDDGNGCTKQDKCNGGGQCVGTAYQCPAATECQQSAMCDGAGGCTVVNKADMTPCTSDGKQCTDDVCIGGACVHPDSAFGVACDDGNKCTADDGCQAGLCIGRAVVCAAQDQCHEAGVCDPQTGLCTNPAKADGAACDDGNGCTRTDGCVGGVCKGADHVVCQPSDQCHEAGVCDPQTGLCTNPARPDGAACDDGSGCTRTDGCVGGVCKGADHVVCQPSDQCHNAGTCDPKTGLCTNPPKTDGVPCDDGDACTKVDKCMGGQCAGTNPVVCAAQDQCHEVGVCDLQTGQCSIVVRAEGSACNDGDACTKADQCAAGICGGESYVCPAPGQCERDVVCDGTGGCRVTGKPFGTSCSTGDPCSKGDHCDGYGACVSGGINPACADGGTVEDGSFDGAPFDDAQGTQDVSNPSDVPDPSDGSFDGAPFDDAPFDDAQGGQDGSSPSDVSDLPDVAAPSDGSFDGVTADIGAAGDGGGSTGDAAVLIPDSAAEGGDGGAACSCNSIGV